MGSDVRISCNAVHDKMEKKERRIGKERKKESEVIRKAEMLRKGKNVKRCRHRRRHVQYRASSIRIKLAPVVQYLRKDSQQETRDRGGWWGTDLLTIFEGVAPAIGHTATTEIHACSPGSHPSALLDITISKMIGNKENQNAEDNCPLEREEKEAEHGLDGAVEEHEGEVGDQQQDCRRHERRGVARRVIGLAQRETIEEIRDRGKDRNDRCRQNEGEKLLHLRRQIVDIVTRCAGVGWLGDRRTLPSCHDCLSLI